MSDTSVHSDDTQMIAAAETAKRNPMRPPENLPKTFGAALKLFVSHPSGQLITLFIAILASWRISLGGFGWADALIAVVLVAYFPLNEWLIHVVMLHYRPRKFFGFTVDFYLPKTHRRHHADPWNPKWVFIPRHIHFWTPFTAAFILWLLWPWKELALTGLTVYLLLGLHYEWVHMLAHIPWCPEVEYYQRRVREHRYHHFRNENYWWGVSMGLGDRLLGTAPDPDKVGRSGTNVTLGIR